MSTLALRQYNFLDDKNNAIPITAARHDAELDNIIIKLNQKAVISNSAPSSPIAGMLWYDSTNKVLKQYRNSEWVLMGPVHYGATAPSTMQFGDIWIDSSGSEAVLKFRNKANGAWISLLQSNATAVDNNFLVPTGAMLDWGTGTPPTGWLICDGSAVSRTTYADLFTLWSTVYGVGDGTTTFNIPDMRERVVVGYKAASSEFGTLGQTGGEKTHVLTTTEMPAHTHALSTYNDGTSGTVAKSASANNPTGGVTGSAGSDGAHNNLQPYITLNKIVKT